jgi:hypothetical protein
LNNKNEVLEKGEEELEKLQMMLKSLEVAVSQFYLQARIFLYGEIISGCHLK